MCPATPIKTERLAIREWRLDDLPVYHAMISDPVGMEHMPGGAVTDMEISGERLAGMINIERTHGFTRWTLTLRETGELIGWCGYEHLERSEEVRFDLFIAPAHRGQGLGSEIAGAVIETGLRQWAFLRLHALAKPDNAAAIRLCEKCGMKQIGDTMHRGETHLLFATQL